ncbi:MAG: hypothetical protein UU78_C0021G0009 [Candidatus Roizmanbacteria bacterium GW2011_GWC2_41_7]|uniref:DUF5655 domain-containing protein n=1 Tax=Candidatus Roizmanbacteria bacterium GW2011_GWC2_41_7 TaxID=1618487 RepID=A0A0G0XB51_9BACT|nr:MAG: hypothetical protein UU78_C0021G0009 [Candidatus Roizmanbacteria bacterium GW2011_GWC2_41_7]KKS40506.1 MAG: hypothetical protein UV04_C0022G0008 [Candidatus Gottesmanbacteria bacterium GW2011_GWA2_42_16]KKS80697.1 MAG: hypothetical protein UV55_C0033G0009 [Candidatus Gottesmanbacteria bacterium GW2011_GWC1_43_10]
MAIFQVKNNKVRVVNKKKFDLEKDIQELAEENLETIFGLKFVSGFLNQEFSVRAQEQDFYIDTLGFDEAQRSLVIIEYKKDRSFSVIDQGFAYLSAMLNHKADFVLELNEKLNKNFAKKDIDWEQSRIIFISPEFTNYQHNAINFKDLPIYLYEVRLYDNGLIEFDPIKPYKTTESIGKLSNDKIIQSVSKEVKVYTVEDLIKPNWTATKTLLEEFEKQIYKLDVETKVKYTKFYIAYMSKHGRNYVEVVPQQQGLKVFYRFPFNYIKSDLQLEDCSKIGHWTNGNSRTSITDTAQIPEAVKLSRDSFYFLHRDIYKTK